MTHLTQFVVLCKNTEIYESFAPNQGIVWKVTLSLKKSIDSYEISSLFLCQYFT